MGMQITVKGATKVVIERTAVSSITTCHLPTLTGSGKVHWVLVENRRTPRFIAEFRTETAIVCVHGYFLPRIKLIIHLAPAVAASNAMMAGARVRKSVSVKVKGTTYGVQAGEEQAATISEPVDWPVRTFCPEADPAVASGTT